MNLTQMLMNQVKARNPQMFQQFQNLQKSQNKPQDVLNNMMKNYSPEQMNKFRQFANGFGITNEQLDKYGVNTKK